MQNATASNTNCYGHIKQQISKVIIRLEIDDLNVKQTSATSSSKNSQSIESLVDSKSSNLHYTKGLEDSINCSNKNIFEIFNYNSSELDTIKRDNEILLKDYSERFESKDEALKLFIGKRESHLIAIETYYFDSKATPMHHGNTSLNPTNQQLVDNALTMQKALETAYNDWNKEKLKSEPQKETENEPIVNETSEDTKINQNDDEEVVTFKKSETQQDESMTKSILIEKNKHLDKMSSESPSLSSSLPSINDLKPSENLNKKSSHKSKNKQLISKVKHQKSLDELTQIESESKADTARSSSSLSSSNQTTEIAYYYGNPTVDLVKGFLHIYKDCNLTPLDDSCLENPLISSSLTNLTPNSQQRSEMLCMIGIPASITCNELLDFVMPYSENMQYMRILRDTYPNQYMALLKFKSQKDADLFYSYNNNRLYNTIEDNVCHLVFVERIEAMNSSKGASLPIPGFSELPTCYICLERMDESLNGVITILCNHSFHGNCLSKWGDTCCPVCRYSQTPEYAVDNTCNECGSNENLWICLICGHIGCGRYVRGHAYSHFQLTQHTYSMQLGNNRVWDYAADNYVHRLIQNKTDGKLIQLDEGGRVVQQDEKIDSITLEYTYLLTSQLESQRLFFEDRLLKIEEKAKLQLIETENKYKQTEEDHLKLKENYAQLTKEKSNFEKKCATLTAKVTKLQTDLNEEKELNKCLTSNQEIYQAKLTNLEESLKKSNQEKEKEIQELQSQLRDIMFYLEAQNKLSESKNVTQEELQNSQLVIQADENAASGVSNASQSSKMANRRRRK